MTHVELAANDDKAGPGESGGGNSYVEYTFVSGGTYYVGISGSGNTSYNAIAGTGDMSGSSGSYTLVVSPGLAGTIRRPADATDYPVDILGFGANPPAINTNQRTWIVIHGWNSSRANGNISAIAADKGLALRIVRAQRFRAVDTMFALLLVFGIIGLLSDLFLRGLRNRLSPWARP